MDFASHQSLTQLLFCFLGVCLFVFFSVCGFDVSDILMVAGGDGMRKRVDCSFSKINRQAGMTRILSPSFHQLLEYL